MAITSVAWGILASLVDNGMSMLNITGTFWTAMSNELMAPLGLSEDIDVMEDCYMWDNSQRFTIAQIDEMATDEIGFYLGRFLTDTTITIVGLYGAA